MDPIPMPQMLDPDRLLINQRGNLETDEFEKSRAELLDHGLRQTCDYAQDLWTTLDGLRRYLLARLPDPQDRDPVGDRCASPLRAGDEQGWAAWMDAYAAVHSVLAGPAGDSGYGRTQAQREAQWRRSAPEMSASAGPRPAERSVAEPATRTGVVGTGLAAAGGFLLGALVRRGPR